MPKRKYKTRGRRTLARPPLTKPRWSRPRFASPAVVNPEGVATATQMEKLLANRGAEIGVMRARSPVKGSTKEQTVPQESARPSRTGARRGNKTSGRRGGDPTYIPPQMDIKEPRHYVQYHGNFTNKIIELPATMMPAPPINLAFKVKQNGNPKRLDNWKSMYPATTVELTSPYQAVGGENNPEAKRAKTTACGFNRSNVHYPSAWRDYVYRRNLGKPVSNPKRNSSGFKYGTVDILACRSSNFNRYQLEEMFWAGYFESMTGASTSWDKFIKDVEQNYDGGDEKWYFPLSSVTTEYTYSNRNIATDLNMSIYICTPKRHLTFLNDPMADWVDWFDQNDKDETLDLSDGIKMNPAYAFEPIITADVNEIGTVSGDGTTQTNTPVQNCDRIITLSTEVVAEASPHGFSNTFRQNWDIVDVKHVKLMPQQTLNFTVTTELSQMLDLQEMFASGQQIPEAGGGLPYVMYKGLTVLPMVKFWGSPISGESSGQVYVPDHGPGVNTNRDLSTPGVNRVLATTQAQSSASMMTQTQRTKCRIHAKNTVVENSVIASQDPFFWLFDNLPNKQRKLLPVGDPSRGQEGPYYMVNDHAGYFCNITTKPGHAAFTANVALLNSRSKLIDGINEPTNDQVRMVDVDHSWDYIETETVSRMQLVKSGSDAGKNNDN